MKQQTTIVLWTCDYRNCKVEAQSYDSLDTPAGWMSIVGAMQTPSGGGPTEFDLCPKHSKTFHATYTVHEED
jgi:hypothetical protein